MFSVLVDNLKPFNGLNKEDKIKTIIELLNTLKSGDGKNLQRELELKYGLVASEKELKEIVIEIRKRMPR